MKTLHQTHATAELLERERLPSISLLIRPANSPAHSQVNYCVRNYARESVSNVHCYLDDPYNNWEICCKYNTDFFVIITANILSHQDWHISNAPTFYTSRSCTCCHPWDHQRRRKQRGNPAAWLLGPRTSCLTHTHTHRFNSHFPHKSVLTCCLLYPERKTDTKFLHGQILFLASSREIIHWQGGHKVGEKIFQAFPEP